MPDASVAETTSSTVSWTADWKSAQLPAGSVTMRTDTHSTSGGLKSGVGLVTMVSSVQAKRKRSEARRIVKEVKRDC